MTSDSIRFDWKKFAICALVAYCLVLGVRMLQPSPLPDQVAMVDGEHILATHDAYTWLIRGINPDLFVYHPFAAMTNDLVSLTGLSHETLAYWAPPFMASLVAVVMIGWMVLLGCPELGIAAAIVTSLSPGFLYRTLLGFYDTDLVMLLCPLLLALAPAVYLRGRILTPLAAFSMWRSKGRQDGAQEASPAVRTWEWGMLLLAGIAGWQLHEMHPFFLYLSKIFPLVGVGLVLLFGRKGERIPLLAGMAVYGLPLGGGWVGIAAALLVLGLLLFPERGDRVLANRYAGVVLVLGILVIGLNGTFWSTLFASIGSYLKPVDNAGESAGANLHVVFPSVVQSVIEAQNLAVKEMLQYFYTYPWVALVGCVGFLFAILFEPVLAFMAPLFVLGLLSFKLGGRMTMFAGPALGVGICYPLHWMLHRFLASRYAKPALRYALGGGLAFLLAVPVWAQMAYMPVTPFISAPHVKALKEIRTNTDPGGTVWTWWDWGYATQFFTRKWTFSDGARHSSDSLYPMAAIYTTDSPRFANQFIKYIVTHQGNVFRAWAGKSEQEVVSLLHDLGTKDMEFQLPEKQYLVVTVDSLKLGEWITRFGSWDFAAKTMSGYKVTKLGQISLNSQFGAFAETTGKLKTPIPMESVDILTPQGVQHKDYFRFNGVHLVIDTLSDTRYVMDAGMYDSMMVRLLVGDPQSEDIRPYFKLVFGNVHTRVYEVL